MAEALAVLGAIGAGLQLAEASAKALIKTIHLVQGLRDTPKKLAVLLEEVEKSTCYVEHLSCNILRTDSKFFAQMKAINVSEGLVEAVMSLHESAVEINTFLSPMAVFGEKSVAKGERLGRLWKSVVSLKMEKELPERLARLNRLNTDVVRELSVVNLQVQMATNAIAVANNHISTQGFAHLGTQLEMLSADIHSLRLTAPDQPLDELDVCRGSQVSSTTSGGGDGRVVGTGKLERKLSSTSTLISLPPNPGTSPSSSNRKEQLRLHMQRRLTTSPKRSPRRDSQLDLVIYSIRTYYSKGNFDPAPAVLQPRFWKDCSNSIYFFKISDLPKARWLLKESTAVNSGDIFTQGAASALIEILSTLSPINTATNPDVRKTLLLYLHTLALEQLPRESPILIVLSRLHEGMDSVDWSLQALKCIVDRLCATLESTNPLRLHAQKRLIALLRRRRDYDAALHTCKEVMEDIEAQLGPGSLQGRKMARMLEHIYMDQEDWISALDVCFDIVNQVFSDNDEPNPDPQWHDECAVWTMEDIAKIYEHNGDLDMAIAWLKQARISGGMVWGPDVFLEHIHDKLLRLLEQSGLSDEIRLWSTAFGPVSTVDRSL